MLLPSASRVRAMWQSCYVPTRYVLFTFTSHALVISLLMSCTCHATVIHLPRTSHTASTCHAPVMQFTCHSKVLYVHQHALVMYQSCTFHIPVMNLSYLSCTCHIPVIHLPYTSPSTCHIPVINLSSTSQILAKYHAVKYLPRTNTRTIAKYQSNTCQVPVKHLPCTSHTLVKYLPVKHL